MAANTQIRHRHSEDRATKIIRAVPPATEAAVLRLLSLSDSSAQPAGHRGRQDPARTRRIFHRKPAHSSRARNVTKPQAVETLSPYRTPTMRAWMSASDAVDLCARDSVTVDPVHRQVWSPRTSGPGPFNAARIWLSPSIRQ